MPHRRRRVHPALAAVFCILLHAAPAAAHPEFDEWFDDLEPVEVVVTFDREGGPPSRIVVELPDRTLDLEVGSAGGLMDALEQARAQRPSRAAAAPAHYLKGRIAGVDDSSVAVSLVGGSLSASVRDGMELVLVEAPEDGPAQAWLTTDPFAGPTMLAPSADITASAEVTKVLTVALVADFEFSQKHGVGTDAKMLAILNLTDAVYRDQLGLALQVIETRIFATSMDPFTEFTSANLFNNYRDATAQFGDWRKTQTGFLKTAGLAHLFSDRNLNVPAGSKINAGFAFIGTLCDDDRGVSLSTAPGIPDSFHAAILSHEFGHNFGSGHDGDAPCASVPDGNWIMEQGVVSTVFSPCTLAVVKAGRDGASCIVASTTTTTTTTLPAAVCGDFNGDGEVKSADALGALRAAVGTASCALCVCDVDSNGFLASSDALGVLRFAVGSLGALSCPAC